MVALSGCCVILGGLVAAVTGPLTLDKGSWLAAYLVLVCGVAQYAIGSMHTRSGARYPRVARSWTQLVCWNLGNVAVMTGTLTSVAHVVDAGAVLLLIALGIALVASLDIGPGDREAAGHEPLPALLDPALLDWAYRGFLVLLLISTPVGMVLAHLPEAT